MNLMFVQIIALEARHHKHSSLCDMCFRFRLALRPSVPAQGTHTVAIPLEDIRLPIVYRIIYTSLVPSLALSVASTFQLNTPCNPQDAVNAFIGSYMYFRQSSTPTNSRLHTTETACTR